MISRIRKSLDEKDQGFTLIELLVVIIIIGILAAIAIPVFLNQRKKAVDAGIKSDLRTVAQSLETYYTDNQKYPATVTDSTGATDGTNKITIDTDAVKLSSGNVIAVTVTGGQTYCIYGYNAKGSGESAAGFTYKSDGGLLPGKADASKC